MKIAIFSDIHGNLPALKAILNDIKENQVDEIICLGDLIAIGPKPKECLKLIFDEGITLVPGNHELYYAIGTHIDENMEEEEKAHQQWIESVLGDEYKEHLQKLPIEIIKNINGKSFCFKHFLTKENSLFPFEEASVVKTGDPARFINSKCADYTFIGHEHRPFTAKKDGKMLIDVGSSGCVKDSNTHYTLLEIEQDVKITKKEVAFSRNALIADMASTNYPDREFLSKIFFGVDVK